MRNLLALVVCLPLAACLVGQEPMGDDDTTMGINGTIAQSTVWNGNILIDGNVTIATGATVMVDPGAAITVKPGATITVAGILDAQGTSTGKISIAAESGNFGGFLVNTGGELRFSHVTQKGGNVTTNGGKTTIVDSRMSHAAGDFVMMNNGTLDVSYSAIGVEPGQTDSTHCDMHFSGGGNVIKVTHSNISSSAYGLMFYGGTSADFTYDNWFGNGVDVDLQMGVAVSGDFSNGWFEKPAPTGTGITANALAGARLAACDGGNDAACAGPRP